MGFLLAVPEHHLRPWEHGDGDQPREPVRDGGHGGQRADPGGGLGVRADPGLRRHRVACGPVDQFLDRADLGHADHGRILNRDGDREGRHGRVGVGQFTWTLGTATGGGTCRVAYTTANQWGGGFVASVTVTDTGTAAISGWTLKFTFPGDQQITNAWSGTASQSGQNVTIANASYNASIAPGGSTSLGFQGTWNTSDAAPAAFTLNGATCTT